MGGPGGGAVCRMPPVETTHAVRRDRAMVTRLGRAGVRSVELVAEV